MAPDHLNYWIIPKGITIKPEAIIVKTQLIHIDWLLTPTDSDSKITRDVIHDYVYCIALHHMYTQGFFSCAANTVYRYLFSWG